MSKEHPKIDTSTPPGVFVNVAEALPDFYEEVRIRDSEGYERIGRRSKRASGCWQIACFEREGSKYPKRNDDIVAWARIYPVDVHSADKVAAMQANDLVVPAARPEPVTRDWVDCPVCGETDMRRERDEEGHPLIFCVNHACASNGGTNMSAIDLPPAPIPEGQELVPSSFVDTVGLMVQASDGLANAHQESEEAEATLKEVSGAAYFLQLGTHGDAVKSRNAFVQCLTKATGILRMTLAKRAANALRKPS